MLMPGQFISWKDFFKELKNEYKTDNVGDVAGSVTFFAMLALFPFLLFAVTLAGVIIEPQQTEQLVQQLGQVAPPDVTRILEERIRQLTQSESGGLLTFGALAALWSASSGVVSLIRAFNTAYDVDETRPFWKVRLIALAAVVLTVVLMLSAVGITVVTPVLARLVGDGPIEVLRWLRLPIAGVLVMGLWALLYSFLPNVKQRFRFITFGSTVGVVVWLVASWGFSVYVQNFGKYEATYGALGGVIVFLLWMWISSQVVLLGAEMNAILEHTSPDGKRPGAHAEEEGTGPAAPKSKEHARAEPGRAGPGRPRPGTQQLAPAHRSPRTRKGSRKKVDKLELALMGVVALGALRKPSRRRPNTLH